MGFLDNTRGIIEKYFNDNFTSCPIAFPSVPFNAINGSAYIALFVNINKRARITLGGAERRINGLVTVQCFSPTDTSYRGDDVQFLGQSGALSLADAVSKMLDADSLKGVCFTDCDISEVGDDGQFWQTNLNCAFWRDSGDF